MNGEGKIYGYHISSFKYHGVYKSFRVLGMLFIGCTKLQKACICCITNFTRYSTIALQSKGFNSKNSDVSVLPFHQPTQQVCICRQCLKEGVV